MWNMFSRVPLTTHSEDGMSLQEDSKQLPGGMHSGSCNFTCKYS
jgi:hypothetical protein